MDMSGLKEAADKLVRANGVWWYGHVLRGPEEDVLIKKMVHKVNGKHKQGQPKLKWMEQVKGNVRRIGLKKKDTADQCKWKEGAGRVAKTVKCIQPPSFTWKI